MFRPFAILSVAILAVGLTACQAQNMGTKQGVGTLGGAALGGLLGSQIGGGTGKLIATSAGVLLGGFLGNEIGASLDKADQGQMVQAEQRAFVAPVGQQISWNNPQSGNSGIITPVRDGYDNAGKYCREFQQQVTVAGKKQQAYGTACRQPDGSWQIVK
jgi:surface antigen